MIYKEYIENKNHSNLDYGFDTIFSPDFLFDFQKYLLDWSLKKGRSATFADCGLGKTPMELVWAQNIIEKTNKPVLLLAPIAVSVQTLREAEKFNIDCMRSQEGKFKGKKIIVSNYERLHYFNPDDFGGVGLTVYSALINGRKGLGIELKTSYYNQAVKNLTEAKIIDHSNDDDFFSEIGI